VRTVGSVTRIGRGLATAAAAVTVVAAVAGCATAVKGRAEALATFTAPLSAGGGSASPPSGGDSAAQQAQRTCSQVPKNAVTTAFGVGGVTVTTDSGTVLTGGILQIKCVIGAQGGFRANVVVQIYPPTLLNQASQYLQIMRSKFPGLRTETVNGADVAGLFQQTVDGGLVDEAFAAKKDSTTGAVDVVLAGVADSPGIDPKLVAFITALAHS
jgi:hypothetical protein